MGDYSAPPRSFDLQPTLEGALIRLRPLHPDDFDSLYDVARDPLIWEQHPASNRHEPDVFREFFREAIESRGALVALDAADGSIIGSSRYFGLDAEKSEIEIGWTFLARRFWGGRYNGEMKSLMLRHAFRFVGTVIFVIGMNNIRSQRAVEAIGAVRRERIDRGGGERVIYFITPEMYGT